MKRTEKGMIVTNTDRMQKNRQMMLTVVCVSVILVIVAALLPVLFLEDKESENAPSFDFADPALSADPSSDTEYMALDRTVYYRTLSGYEITVSLREDMLSELDAELSLIFRLVGAAKAGDEDGYNACFAKEYLKTSGRAEAFTPQKLYDITVTLYDGATPTVPKGYSTVRVYGLVYKIKDNNGTLRRDMGSDAVKEQLLFVVKDAEGDAAVYAVQTQG